MFTSLGRRNKQTPDRRQVNTMKNEKDLINKVAKMYAMATGDTSHEKLARFILSNYYGVDTFFLIKEGDYSSGLDMHSVDLFTKNMKRVVQAVNGEL